MSRSWISLFFYQFDRFQFASNHQQSFSQSTLFSICVWFTVTSHVDQTICTKTHRTCGDQIITGSKTLCSYIFTHCACKVKFTDLVCLGLLDVLRLKYRESNQVTGKHCSVPATVESGRMLLLFSSRSGLESNFDTNRIRWKVLIHLMRSLWCFYRQNLRLFLDGKSKV